MGCEGCPYSGQRIVPYVGSGKSGILVIGEAPGREEVIAGQPFVGKSGKILDKCLEHIGVARKDIIIANTLKCQIDNTNKKKVNEGRKHCSEYLEALIKKAKPKLIITLGAIALQQLTKQQKMLSNRGRVFKTEVAGVEYNVFATVHPAYVLRNCQANFPNIDYTNMIPVERMLLDDFNLAKRIVSNGEDSIKIMVDNYKWVKDVTIASNSIVAFDYETNAIDPHNDASKALCCSFSIAEGASSVIRFSKQSIPKGMKRVLEDKTIVKVVAARPFEETVTRMLGGKIQGPVDDVLTMAHILNENMHINLEAVANAYTPLKNIKSLAEGMRFNLDEADEKTLLQYSGVDADATRRAYISMIEEYKKPWNKDLLRYYINFMRPIQNMFGEIVEHGVKIDLATLTKNEESLVKLMTELEKDAIAKIPPVIRLLHQEKGLRLSRSELVADYLFNHPKGKRRKPLQVTEKTKKPAITEAHLKNFQSIPFVQLYLRWKKAQKILTTYFPIMYKAIRDDGRIYPSTLFINTTTGRTVMVNPTVQTVPQRGEFAPYIKEAIVADTGWLLGTRDLSQSELRIMGWLADDTDGILKALSEGIDLHTYTAAMVNNCKVEDVTPDMRQKAKAINFGFIYGMSARSFRVYAKNNYGVEFTEVECNAIRDKFFKTYNKLKSYYNRVTSQLYKEGNYITSPLGRRRRLPGVVSEDEFLRAEAIRQGINFPIQSFSSDLGLIGMMLFWEAVKEKGWQKYIKPLWFIHDAVMFTARCDYFDRAMDLLKECMEKGACEYVFKKFGVEVGYPVESEGKVGTTWANMKKYKEDKK